MTDLSLASRYILIITDQVALEYQLERCFNRAGAYNFIATNQKKPSA